MKVNRILIGMTSMATIIGMTACSNEEADFQQSAHQSNVINLTSALAQTRTTSDPQAIAINTSNKVGVFVTYNDAPITNGNNNEHTVESNGNLSTANAMNYPTEDGATVDIYAYAPYASSMTLGSNNFAVAADQSTAAGYLASDLIYASKTGQEQSESAVALNFSHKLAKINVTIQQQETSTLDLTSATVTVTNTKIATTFDPTKGTVGEASGSETDIKAASALGSETTACAIIVPQQLAAGTQLVKIIADGKQLNAKLTDATTFESGISYNFTVNIGTVEEPVTEVTLTLGSTAIASWDDQDLCAADSEDGEIEPITLTATFQTHGSNATYNAPTYTWTGSTSNLMTVFEFANGELANYHTLKFTFSNLVDGPVRMGYYVGSTFTEFGSGYYSAGEKTVDLTALGIDLSTVTKIAFGGRSNAGSCDIVATDVILIGNGDGSSTGGDDTPSDDGKLYATFGTPGGNASYDGTSFTYAWTGSTNNLMNCFSFENGELANYTTLNFAFTELTADASVRINVLYSDNTNNSKLYYTAGTKATPITELLSGDKTAADVTAIRFGGNSNSGSTVVKASEMYLE